MQAKIRCPQIVAHLARRLCQQRERPPEVCRCSFLSLSGSFGSILLELHESLPVLHFFGRVDFIMKGGGMAGRHVSYFGSEGGSILCERWMESLDPKVVAY